VVLGGIGLAELLQPGVVDKLLALDMSGSPIQLILQGGQLELSWPLTGGWHLQQSTNLTTWLDSPDTPNPYFFNPTEANVFYRITR